MPETATRTVHPIARQLAHARRNQGLTQAHVAAQLHVSHNTIHNWEAGKAEPSLADLVAWATVLGYHLTLITHQPQEGTAA